MKKILVIGCKGMAGHVIMLYLKNLRIYDVWGLARNIKTENNVVNLDVFDVKKLENLIIKEKFQVVINCIGLLNKNAEENPQLAIWINSYLPHLLASFGKKYNFKLIHISTDCVFSGNEGGYNENSFKNGIGFYAQSKALGEIVNSRDLTFRTSIIGPELKNKGIGLFHWFMNQDKEVSGFSNAYWTGVTTVELSEAINQSIQQNLTGLYHLVNNQKISKYELINLFNENFKQGKIKVIKNIKYSVDKSLVNSRKDFNYLVPSYVQMIKNMKKWILDYNDDYKHYNQFI